MYKIVFKQDFTKEELEYLYNVKKMTLQDIGNTVGITRERVRQIMNELGVNRNKREKFIIHKHESEIKTFDDVVEKYPNGIPRWVLSKYIKKDKCEKCGYDKTLDIHHIKYPAKNRSDVMVLCKSCHRHQHNPKMTTEKQNELYNLYMQGVKCNILMDKYNISKPLVYVIIKKIKNGYRTNRGY
jgi:5-methylcytosine-specific restriction endonuclease McrA